CIVAACDIFYMRQLGRDPNEATAAIELLERREQLGRLDLASRSGLNRYMDAAGERAGVRHEVELDLRAGRGLRQRNDFRSVPMSQRVVGVQIAVTLRMMRARCRRAARAGAARDAGDEQARLD